MEIPVIHRTMLSKVAIIHPSTGSRREYIGLWDTGAQETAITERVVAELGLSATGNSIIVGGIDDVGNHRNRHFAGINIGVGKSKRIQPIVIQNRFDQAFDVVIGMDIIETLSFFKISDGILTIE
jgi:predicted aspartyl protease